VVLTHGHEDHIGAVPYFLSEIDVPVYGTAFTLALVERRLEEYELDEEPRLITVKPKQIIDIGPFKVEFIHVTHSIVSAVALAITTPLGVIIHTGDFKVDPTPTDNELFDLHTLADYGKRGVLLLLSDSTNADRPGYTESERAVRPRMEEIFNRSDKRIVVSCFSSSIHRIQLVLDLAHQYGRRVAVIGRSMVSVTEIAHSLGLLDIPDGILLRPQDAMDLPPEKVAILISGTQGEPMSALSRVAVDNHKHISVEPGDTVVLSARIIPGNEKGIFRMIDHMARRGADVLYGSMNPPLHVSGHGSIEEMKLVLNLVRPRFFMPVHGEFRQLSKHAKLAEHLRFAGLEDSFVMESGDVLEIDHHGARKAGKVPVGRVCIDSGSVDDVVQEMVIRDRRHLSEDGIVLPIIAINRHTGKMENPPEIVSRGFAVAEDGSNFAEEARQVVTKTVENSNQEEKTDWGVIKEKIRADLKRHIVKQTSRRPLIMPVILEV
jgi:ribonuclease J